MSLNIVQQYITSAAPVPSYNNLQVFQLIARYLLGVS